MDNATGKKRKRKRRPKKKAPLRRRPCSFYRKFRISGAYSGSVRSFSEQLIRNQSLQKSVSIPPFPSSDSAQGSPAVSWRWREPALQSRSPLIVWPGPCPVPTHITALQSALSRQRSSGSPLKIAWSAATFVLSAPIPSHLLFLPWALPSGFLEQNTYEPTVSPAVDLAEPPDLDHPVSRPLPQPLAGIFLFPLLWRVCSCCLERTQGRQERKSSLHS